MSDEELAVRLMMRLLRRVREKLGPSARHELEDALEEVSEEAATAQASDDFVRREGRNAVDEKDKARGRKRDRDPDKDRPADQDGRAPVVDLAKDAEALRALARKAGIVPGEPPSGITLEELARRAGIHRR